MREEWDFQVCLRKWGMQFSLFLILGAQSLKISLKFWLEYFKEKKRVYGCKPDNAHSF